MGRRVLVVEDDPLMLALVADVLRGQNFEVRTACDVVDAQKSIRAFDPDVVILDISLGHGPTGLDLGFLLHRQRPDIAILFLTRHPDPRTAGTSLDDFPPNAGFLRKDLVPDTDYLIESIDTVLADRGAQVRHNEDPSNALAGLSAKHLDVLRLVSLGYTNEHIARLKDVNNSTVERWIAEVFKELGITATGQVNPRIEAVRRFIAAAGIPERA